MENEVKIFVKYQEKNFSVCLELIDAASERSRSLSTYKILKAACLVSLKKKIDEAHCILDEVLIKEAGNAFAHYGKGLAFFEQEKFSQAIKCFDKAIEHNQTESMQKAREMKEKAEIKLKDHATAEGRVKGEEKKLELVNETAKSEKKIPSKGIKIKMTQKTAKVAKNRESVKQNSDEKKCKYCDRTFKTIFNLLRHMRAHSNERPHECDKCSYAAKQKSDLTRHLTTHDKNFTYYCSKCDKKFKTQENQQVHQMTHIKERPFQCKLCPNTFKLDSLLKFHESHHEVSSHMSCDHCGKKFSEKKYLTPHIKTHSNEQPFGCNLCKVTFKTIARMGFHFREYHGVGKGKV